MEPMHWNLFDALLALAPSPTAPGTQPNPQADMVKTFGMLGIMAFMFYFALIRPQRQRAKQQQELLKALKAGDKVVTTSGIVGTVVSVKEKSVSIRSADTKLEVLKSSVSEITERGAQGSEA